MGNYGIKVSQSGSNVLTADKEDLVFSSQYDTLKLFVSGSGSVSVPHDDNLFTPGSTTVEISHNLSYKPAFICFSTNPWWSDDNKFSPYTWRSIGSLHNQANYAVDTTKLYLTFYNPDPDDDDSVYYRYHIYYNQLA